MAFNTGHATGIEALEQLGVHDVSQKRTSYANVDEKDDKNINDEIRYVPTDEESGEIGTGMTAAQKVDNMEEIALYALHVEDDPSLNPWTMRTWFLSISPLHILFNFMRINDLTDHRPWALVLLRCTGDNLPVQATRNFTVSDVPVRDQLRSGSGPRIYSKIGLHRPLVQPSSFQSQRACRDPYHVFYQLILPSFSIPKIYRSCLSWRLSIERK